MNRKVGLVVVIVAVIGLGGGAATITWLRARQAPENMALGNDRGRVDEDHEQADPHGHGQERDGTDEDDHGKHEDPDGHDDHAGHDDEDRNGQGSEDSPDHDEHEDPDGHDDHAGHDDEDRNGQGSEDSPDHDEHEDPDGHDDHAGHDDEAEEPGVQLSAEERKRFGVEVAVAGPGSLATQISLPGEIVLNADRVAHIVPRAPGIVREVLKNVGDTVRAGETMAWLESAELGEAKVDYLAKGAALSGSTVDLTRAQEVRDNTIRFLEILNSNPSLETLRDTNGSAMGENRSILVSAYAEFVYSKAAYEREKPLFEKKVASERDFQAAEAEYKKADALNVATRDRIAFKIQRDLLEATRAQQVRAIELEGARGRLYVLGLTSEEIAELEVHALHQTPLATQQAGSKARPDAPEGEGKLAWYPLRAPFDGRVIEKHLTLGEKHSDDAGAFTVADLSSVWVDIAVYQKDLAFVKEGMNVSVSAGAGMPSAPGVISYVSPLVDEKTRTAMARAVLPNSSGEWRPGLFVSAEIAIGDESAAVVVPKSAIQRMGEEQVVFLDTIEGLKPVPVSLGRGSASHVEVLFGLANGQRYVTEGAFELKAKIVTSGLGAHAGHGH